MPSVVQVLVPDGAGSGVQVPEGVLTNAHVLGAASKATLILHDGSTVQASLAARDGSRDLALLFADTGLPALEMEDAGQQRPGETVLVLGFPKPSVLGLGGEVTVSRGIVSAIRRPTDGRVLVQTDAAVNNGNSGGAMVNSAGRLIGLPTFGIKDSQGLNFAVGAETIRDFLSGITEPARSLGHPPLVVAPLPIDTASAERVSPLLVLEGHTGWVRAAAFSPDGAQIATGGGNSSTDANAQDQSIRLWSAENGRPLRVLTGHEGNVSAIAYSPDGSLLASTSFDRTTKLWRATDGALLATMPSRVAFLTGASFLDGRTLLTGDGQVWSVPAGSAIRQIATCCGAFSIGGGRLARISGDAVAIVDLASGRDLRRIQGSSRLGWAGISLDGRRVGAADYTGEVGIWLTEDGRKETTIRKVDSQVFAIAFAPIGDVVATAGQGPPRLWNTTSGELLRTLPGHTGWVTAVAFSADGTRIVTGSNDGTAVVWGIRSAE